MNKKDVTEYLESKLKEAGCVLLKPGFSTFLEPMVFIEYDSNLLEKFPDYYQVYFKAHFMETGYMPFAFPYTKADQKQLAERWTEWYQQILIIKGSILKELKKLPQCEHYEELPEGFI